MLSLVSGLISDCIFLLSASVCQRDIGTVYIAAYVKIVFYNVLCIFLSDREASHSSSSVCVSEGQSAEGLSCFLSVTYAKSVSAVSRVIHPPRAPSFQKDKTITRSPV